MSYSTMEIIDTMRNREFRIRGLADFNRFDMSRSQRDRYHRTLKLEKKDRIRDAISSF